MTKPIPVERDLVLALWARLALIEQCSLAILQTSFPTCRPARPTQRAPQHTPAPPTKTQPEPDA